MTASVVRSCGQLLRCPSAFCKGYFRLGFLNYAALRHQSSQPSKLPVGYVPETSLSKPPWPEVKLPDPEEEKKQHIDIVHKVNDLIATRQYGRLFAVVHFASRQWKVTNEDLILIENHIDAECGERICLEKNKTDRRTFKGLQKSKPKWLYSTIHLPLLLTPCSASHLTN
ncbi:39S ribosomal protein L21, mitochondrial isoform X2 [Polypterus senegalus]|uniref:39S ribosomal protein L21, mitochondrial isoform X2 n=1 Tax=Polypterus senegalus TaxID=55291 RepID=UPI0019645160|nr:39S ribosomal protein L21, mitochondrial isoform X2 [Polypterus senegalus]